METIEIPGWAVYTFALIFLPWLTWLTLKTFDNQKSIALNNLNDQNVTAKLNEIQQSVTKLDVKLDSLLAQEINFLKSYIRTFPGNSGA